MTPLVIILIVMGAGVLIYSCFLVDKNNGDIYSSLDSRELSLTEMEDIKNKVQSIISDVTDESIMKAEDKLSQISNEKIIAVNDFSNQVMEKISQNHEEVVFLYNMLNDKESEIKDTVKNFDKVKRQLTESNKIEPAVIKSNEKSDKNTRKVIRDTAADSGNLKAGPEFLNNHNQKILEMFSQGFSVVDISRTLELGQGEVKLVIDLYKEK
ncbi:MAG: DUF6115 domain-containing protein [Anaerocolumna sp.]